MIAYYDCSFSLKQPNTPSKFAFENSLTRRQNFDVSSLNAETHTQLPVKFCHDLEAHVPWHVPPVIHVLLLWACAPVPVCAPLALLPTPGATA